MQVITVGSTMVVMLNRVTKRPKTGYVIEIIIEKQKNNLLKQIPLLKDITFSISDYKDLFNDYWNHIFTNKKYKPLIYCDPPYANTKQFSNSKGFNHDEFWQTMREWSKNNIVYISELQAPDDFECVWEQEVSRSIKATDKSRAVEKLFRYKGE